MSTTSWVHRLYRRLIVSSGQPCPELSEQACRYVADNFVLMLVSRFFSKLADALSNPKIVLPWVMETVHAPLYLLGFLVPIRESGSLLPQVVIASYVRRLTIRKWVWVVGKLVEVAAMAAIALVAWLAEGSVAGWSILLLLVVFSLARGFCSVASKDVTGKTIAKNARGQTNGWSASSAGLVTVILGGRFPCRWRGQVDGRFCRLTARGCRCFMVVGCTGFFPAARIPRRSAIVPRTPDQRVVAAFSPFGARPSFSPFCHNPCAVAVLGIECTVLRDPGAESVWHPTAVARGVYPCQRYSQSGVVANLGSFFRPFQSVGDDDRCRHDLDLGRGGVCC